MALSVLLVDDDPSVLKMLELAFRQEGYSTRTATDGQNALDLLSDAPPDLVVTDVNMPIMDGHEFCRRVRRSPQWEALPFIFLSSLGTPDDRIAGLEVGADDYVVKPFDRRELLARAKALLGRARVYRRQLTSNAQVATSPVAHAMTETSIGPAYVLVVDDDAPMRKLIEIYLKKANLEISSAANGQEALDAASRRAPDLIISDVMMPVMDGIELRRRLLGVENLRAIPFLFLTARGQTDDMLDGLRLGVDDYLTKPIDPQVLVQKTQNLVERHRSRAQHYRKQVQDAAHRITMHLEPEAPRLSGISVVQRNAPLEVRGGDYYDYVDLGNGRTAFVLGDVMGKKWGAWFFSVAYIAYLRSVIRGTSATLASPAEIIRQVNSLLWDDLKISEVFTTLVFGIIEPARRRITYANAGHLPPITYSAEHETATMGTGGGLILGVQPDQNYDEIIVQFAPGDMLVFYTDGITEARNHAGEFFGEDRLTSTVQDLAANGSQDVVEGLYAALDEFVEHMPYDDDRTLLVMRADN